MVTEDSSAMRCSAELFFKKIIFLKHDFDEILFTRMTANLLYKNPVERCHPIANLSLVRIVTMSKKMSLEPEKVIYNVNSNQEIRELFSSNKQLEKELKGSLSQPKALIEQVFQSLSLKGSNFKMFQPSTNVSAYSDKLTKAFEENILSLNPRSDFIKTKYPKFYDFYTKHCVNQTYHFHVFK